MECLEKWKNHQKPYQASCAKEVRIIQYNNQVFMIWNWNLVELIDLDEYNVHSVTLSIENVTLYQKVRISILG